MKTLVHNYTDKCHHHTQEQVLFEEEKITGQFSIFISSYFIMEEPHIYSKYKGLQKTDAIYVIENYLRLIKWSRNSEEILDIGCGDGQVTIEILLPNLPRNCSRIIGTDKSENMVNFAKRSYSSISRTQFVTFDISEEILPEQFQQRFDHIFSFYCLHWVQNQR